MRPEKWGQLCGPEWVLGCPRGARKVEGLTSRVGGGGASNAGSGS